MGDDIAIRRLAEILSAFYVEGKVHEEDLTYSITKKCLQNIKNILLIKQVIIYSRWVHSFDTFPVCLSSPEMYLRYVLFACRQEVYMNLKIFERFLSVFCLLICITGEMFNKTKVNFRKVIPDIFMLLYEKEMKKTFERCGGFLRFIEYINSHEYLEVKNDNYLIFCYKPNSTPPEDFRKQMEKVIRKEHKFTRAFKFEDAERDLSCLLWAQTIFKRTGIKPPSLLEDSDLKEELYEQKIEQPEEEGILEVEVKTSEVTLKNCSNLNSDSETCNLVRQIEDEEWYENVIEAVIRYNYSKSSDHTNKKNKIQKEVDDILKSLKEKIMSLYEIIAEYETD
ncbi:hypothetical protein HNY73_019131 [Argiope bruennichi]|uniref:Uncharacterized protein n=1 Tax=Argiope bruennichi TaxID=94029 RepID=A0A8T0EFG7_ARGBR|nr:hypothetical protein HNY73_019131 [Argiope bruennichi]